VGKRHIIFQCDRGVIPLESAVVYQNGQLAAIAWKGGEEILIVSSSLYVRPISAEIGLTISQKTIYALEFIAMHFIIFKQKQLDSLTIKIRCCPNVY